MNREAIRAFVTTYPEWRGVQDALAIRPSEGWQYVLFHGSEIGRVKIDGKKIMVESFVSK